MYHLPIVRLLRCRLTPRAPNIAAWRSISWVFLRRLLVCLPPPRGLFESFFAASALSPPTLHFNWFDRVRQSLTDADARMASFLASGRSDHAFLPSCHLTDVVRGEHSGAKAVPVHESVGSF